MQLYSLIFIIIVSDLLTENGESSQIVTDCVIAILRRADSRFKYYFWADSFLKKESQNYGLSYDQQSQKDKRTSNKFKRSIVYYRIILSNVLFKLAMVNVSKVPLPSPPWHFFVILGRKRESNRMCYLNLMSKKYIMTKIFELIENEMERNGITLM